MTEISENILKLNQTEYDNLIEPYGDAMSLIIVKLESLNKDFRKKKIDYPIHNIQHRIKSRTSLEKKIKKREVDCSLETIKQEITDIAGIRVICYSKEDVYNVVEIIRKSKELVEIKCTDYINEPKENGYKSFHLVLGVPVYHSDGMEYYPVEIQLRTLGMDFWASMEHRYCYKNDNETVKSQMLESYKKYAKHIEQLENGMKN